MRKPIATVHWIHDVAIDGILYEPQSRILNYPFPAYPIPGAAKMVRRGIVIRMELTIEGPKNLHPPNWSDPLF